MLTKENIEKEDQIKDLNQSLNEYQEVVSILKNEIKNAASQNQNIPPPIAEVAKKDCEVMVGNSALVSKLEPVIKKVKCECIKREIASKMLIKYDEEFKRMQERCNQLESIMEKNACRHEITTGVIAELVSQFHVTKKHITKKTPVPLSQEFENPVASDREPFRDRSMMHPFRGKTSTGYNISTAASEYMLWSKSFTQIISKDERSVQSN